MYFIQVRLFFPIADQISNKPDFRYELHWHVTIGGVFSSGQYSVHELIENPQNNFQAGNKYMPNI